MPSEIDQAAPQQSIQERLSSVFSAQAPEPAEAVEAAAEDTDTDPVDDSESEENAQSEQPAIEEIEIEVEGWKGKIPTKLKAEIDKGADYTRKTQELADQKRLFESQLRVQQEQQAFMNSARAEYEQLQQIEAQLEQYKRVDLTQIDSDNLNRMSMASANLREERAKLKETLDGRQAEFKQKMLTSWDQMTQNAHAAITKAVPNWDKVSGEVAQYALGQGFPFEHITGYDRTTRERVGPGVVDPLFAKTLYKAMQYDKLQTSKATTTNKIANAPPVLRPGASNQGQVTSRQKALVQQHKQKGSVDSAAALLKRYFKDT
jgi:hypothetical protein